jgi:hypothetical protein
MGYGNENENALPTTFFKINGLKKGSTEIFFEGKTKVNGEYQAIDSQPLKLFGHLTSVSTKEFEFENETHTAVRLVIDSDKDRVILEGGFSSVMTGLINTIAGNENPIDKIELGVYISKKGYPSMSISIDGGSWEDNKWKFDYTKKLKPLIEETKDKKGKVVDWDKTELISFLSKEIASDEFQAKIKGNPPKASSQPEASVDVDEPAPADDLPF